MTSQQLANDNNPVNSRWTKSCHALKKKSRSRRKKQFHSALRQNREDKTQNINVFIPLQHKKFKNLRLGQKVETIQARSKETLNS